MGSRGKPGVQMVGPWWRGVVQPPPNPSTSPVSLSQNVTGDLGRHRHLGLRVLLLSCPTICLVWGTSNSSVLASEALGTVPTPPFASGRSGDFGTQPSPPAGQGTLAERTLQGLAPQQHLSPFTDVDLTCWEGGLSTPLSPPSNIPPCTPPQPGVG